MHKTTDTRPYAWRQPRLLAALGAQAHLYDCIHNGNGQWSTDLPHYDCAPLGTTAYCGTLLLRLRCRAGHARLASSTVAPNAITVRESLRSAARSDA